MQLSHWKISFLHIPELHGDLYSLRLPKDLMLHYYLIKLNIFKDERESQKMDKLFFIKENLFKCNAYIRNQI